jgi:nitroreductase
MNLYEAMATQRAIRRLKPDPIPHDVLSRIFQAAAWAPTGGNVQPFRMVAVTDRDKLGSLGALYSKQWAVYTEGMRAEGEALAPARKKNDAGR